MQTRKSWTVFTDMVPPGRFPHLLVASLLPRREMQKKESESPRLANSKRCIFSIPGFHSQALPFYPYVRTLLQWNLEKVGHSNGRLLEYHCLRPDFGRRGISTPTTEEICITKGKVILNDDLNDYIENIIFILYINDSNWPPSFFNHMQSHPKWWFTKHWCSGRGGAF